MEAQSYSANKFLQVDCTILQQKGKVGNIILIQGCCLMGARSPEVSTICSLETKISNKEPAQVPKTFDS